MGWAVDGVEIVSAVARPLARVRRVLAPGVRLLVLSEDATTPGALAALLADAGYGGSALTVLAQLGGPDEDAVHGTAAGLGARAGRPAERRRRLPASPTPMHRSAPRSPGLPDDAYDHDGQLTKREIRAVTLALLAPRAGELLWDVGAGNGSIGIEWLRAHRACRAVAVESDDGPGRPDRDERRTRWACRRCRSCAVGLPRRWPGCRRRTPCSSAAASRTRACSTPAGRRCAPGGRLVANAVTLEAEAVLVAGRARHGGELTRSRWPGPPRGRVHRLAAGDAGDDLEHHEGRHMTVHFIGAGPGAVDLLTLRARDLIAASPVCLYAGTYVPPEMLDLCPEGARTIDTANMTLAEIVDEMVAAHRQGLDVARLASGDLSVFSALAEQMRRLDALGVPYDLCPGVPAYAAAAAALGRELTVPTVAQTVTLTRISALATPMPDGEGLAELGRSGGTLVLHLSVHRIDEVVAQLVGRLRARLPGGGRRPRLPPARGRAARARSTRCPRRSTRPASGWPRSSSSGRRSPPSTSRTATSTRTRDAGAERLPGPVLILGGTAEARALAAALVDARCPRGVVAGRAGARPRTARG